jgi:hypothetical protein
MSRDNKLQVVEMTSFSTNRYILMFGSLNGGTPTTFADISEGLLRRLQVGPDVIGIVTKEAS